MINMKHESYFLLLLAFMVGIVSVARAAESSNALASASALAASDELAKVEQQWGIKFSGLFLSAGGNMVDFRYKVLDPQKAALLTKPELKPMLSDQTTGAKLEVPTSPKTGPMRQTTKLPVTGKIYFMLFANTRHHVKSGDKVTITAGDFKMENLLVE